MQQTIHGTNPNARQDKTEAYFHMSARNDGRNLGEFLLARIVPFDENLARQAVHELSVSLAANFRAAFVSGADDIFHHRPQEEQIA